MLRNFLIGWLLIQGSNAFALYDPKDVPWLAELAKAKIYFFHVCGSSEIRPSPRSLTRHFAFGEDNQGFFFTDAPSTAEYRAIIRDVGIKEAKATFASRFAKTHLWRYTSSGVTDLGTPTKVESQVKATAGPTISFGIKQDYVLKYSTDLAVPLKVKGESQDRVCNFRQIIEVNGSEKRP